MKLHNSLIFAVLLSLLLANTAHSQGSHTLQGRVIAPNGSQPTAPVKVSLTLNGRHIYETFTDLSGRFSFPGLAKGTYQVTAEGDGRTFIQTSVYAEVSAFGNAPQMFSVDIQLRSMPRNAISRAALVSSFSQDVPKAALENFERAIKLSADGHTDDAVSLLKEAVRIFPKYFDAHLVLGNQFLKAGRFDEAISELDLAREVNPNDERLYQSFGLILMRQGKFPIAVAVFAEAARLNPTSPTNALMKANALIHQAYSMNSQMVADRAQLLNKAEAAMVQASNLSDKKAKLDHLTLAMLYEMKTEPLKAAVELEEYLRENPNAQNAQDLRTIIAKLRSPAPSPSPSKSPQ